MATKGTSRAFPQIILKCFGLLFVSELISCYSYPFFGARRYYHTIPIQHSPYFTYPISRYPYGHYISDYEDELFVSPEEDYEYSAYEKYPYIPPHFGYYPSRDYYWDETVGRSMDGFEYYDDRIPQDSMGKLDKEFEQENKNPFGVESWHEDEHLQNYDSNSKANAKYLKNFVTAQKHEHDYDSTNDDYEEHWFYGIPIFELKTKNEDKEQFKNKKDEEVKELKSLTSISKNKSNKLKDKEQMNSEVIEKPMKPKSKMTHDEYFDMQKQIIVNSRKNKVPTGESLSRKQKKMNLVNAQNNYWDVSNGKSWPSSLESATNNIKKLNLNKNAKRATDLRVSDSKIKVKNSRVSSTPALSKRSVSIGQKEVVLPRPSNLIRRPILKLSSRSTHQPSVYDKVKKFLNVDKDSQ